MSVCKLRFLLLPAFLISACLAQSQSAPRDVSLKAQDGTLLKATYFPAAKPGPGVLLLHQCDAQRKVWIPLAKDLNSLGMHVLTLDYRGFGESGGPAYDKLSFAEQNKVVTETWPGDIDVAFHYLVTQPGIQGHAIGAGGASCGVNNSVQLARRHSEVRDLVLLSGGANRDGRLFLHKTGALPIFTAAADDDQYGNFTFTMRWLFSESPNPASRFQSYPTGRHGAEMFAVHPELPSLIARWFQAALSNDTKNLPSTNGSPMPHDELAALIALDQPDAATQAAKLLSAIRQHDPKAVTLPEAVVNQMGYERLQGGDTKAAVEIMRLNAIAYPDSANVYDSLSDAYLADGQKELALVNAKKALELLPSDKTDPEQRKNGIKDSAERKIKQLRQSQ